MRVTLKCGRGERDISIADAAEVAGLRPASLPALADPARALARPRAAAIPAGARADAAPVAVRLNHARALDLAMTAPDPGFSPAMFDGPAGPAGAGLLLMPAFSCLVRIEAAYGCSATSSKHIS